MRKSSRVGFGIVAMLAGSQAVLGAVWFQLNGCTPQQLTGNTITVGAGTIRVNVFTDDPETENVPEIELL